MILYYITITTLIIFAIIYLLTYCGLIFKNSKFRLFIKSELFSYVFKKIAFAIFSLFLIITIVFLLTEMIPTNNFDSTEDSIFSKFLNYFYNILPIPKKICSNTTLENNKIVCSSYKRALINLGVSSSYMKNISVLTIIKEKCLISFFIGILAYFIQCLIGYPLGIYLAKKENNLANKSFNLLHTLVKITPSVIYFYLFVILFLTVFKLPVLFEKENLLTYIAPLSALTLSSSLSIAYFVRKYVLLEFNKDYVKFAVSKGLSENRILYKHVMRNALLPFVRTIPSSILLCFSGYYILESSFNIPGIGLTLMYAIQLKDINLIRGIIIFFVFLSIIAFLIGDLLTFILNKKESFKKKVINNG